MMKLLRIAVWNTPSRRYTFLRRCYDNPDIIHTVWLGPDKVETFLFKDDAFQACKPGIQHRVRPSTL